MDEARRLESDVSEIKRRLASTPSENDVRQGGVNWFKTHLNWTYLLGYLAGYAFWFGFDTPYFGLVRFWIVLLPMSAWVLRQKGRRLWWLLLSALGSPLWLGNRKTGQATDGQYTDDQAGARLSREGVASRQILRISWMTERNKVGIAVGIAVGIVLSVELILALRDLGGDSSTATYSTPKVDRPTTATWLASSTWQPSSTPVYLSTTATYMDQQRTDVVASFGQPVTLSGMQVIVTNPGARQLGYSRSNYCVTVAYRNIDDRTHRFGSLDWRLQLPNGVVEGSTIDLRPEALDSADLVAGGNVTGDVCFKDLNQSGQHILIWKPTFNPARGIWLITH